MGTHDDNWWCYLIQYYFEYQNVFMVLDVSLLGSLIQSTNKEIKKPFWNQMMKSVTQYLSNWYNDHRSKLL